MLKDDLRSFDEKAELIYEFDKSSPLFVRRANKEIELNNLDESISILQSGLDTFPEYPTAHILLGRALSLKGLYNQALKHYHFAAEIIDSEKSYNSFLKEIESYKKMRSPFSQSKRATHVEESVPLQTDENSELDESDDLAELARKISNAKIEVVEEDLYDTGHSSDEDDNHIVSETLAKIYTAQGKLTEAVSVYRLLILKFPRRKSEFSAVIKELEQRLIN